MENSAIEGMKSLELEDRDAASPKTRLLLSREKLAADRFSLMSAMEKAAVEGFKPKDSEAAIRKIRICVEGYDTSLPYDDVKSALRSHFSSCGEIMDICIPRYVEPDSLNRYALIVLLGEDAVEKALKLHGSDVGRWKVLVRDYPIPGELTPEMAAKIAINNCYPTYVTFSGYWMSVSGYDTSLPDDDIKRVMIKHFSPCGPITQVRNRTSYSLVRIEGRSDVTEKAQKLSGGCDVEGCKITVDKVIEPKRHSSGTGYCAPPVWLKKVWLKKRRVIKTTTE